MITTATIPQAIQDMAAKLDGIVELTYEPRTAFDDDESSRGHLVSVDLPESVRWESDDLSMLVDDRYPLGAQIVLELERVSRLYAAAASNVEAKVTQ